MTLTVATVVAVVVAVVLVVGGGGVDGAAGALAVATVATVSCHCCCGCQRLCHYCCTAVAAATIYVCSLYICLSINKLRQVLRFILPASISFCSTLA